MLEYISALEAAKKLSILEKVGTKAMRGKTYIWCGKG